jgi:hypothetical protein
MCSLKPRSPTNFDDARLTALGTQAIWLHQFDRVPGASLPAIRDRWPGAACVKALDGVDWMARFDRSPLAVAGVTPSNWSWRELGWIP